jgi:hypothetical protein
MRKTACKKMAKADILYEEDPWNETPRVRSPGPCPASLVFDKAMNGIQQSKINEAIRLNLDEKDFILDEFVGKFCKDEFNYCNYKAIQLLAYILPHTLCLPGV